MKSLDGFDIAMLVLALLLWARVFVLGLALRRRRIEKERLATLPTCKHGARGIERKNCPQCRRDLEEYFKEPYGLPCSGIPMCESCATVKALREQPAPKPAKVSDVKGNVVMVADGPMKWGPSFVTLDEVRQQFSPGQWVRSRSGSLLRVCKPVDSKGNVWVTNQVAGSWDHPAWDLSPASPKPGEWWIWSHSGEQVLSTADGLNWSAAVKTGALAPVNFGRGRADLSLPPAPVGVSIFLASCGLPAYYNGESLYLAMNGKWELAYSPDPCAKCGEPNLWAHGCESRRRG